VHPGGVQGFFQRERRQNPWQAAGAHRLARPRRPGEEDVVRAGCCDLECPLPRLLPLYVPEVGACRTALLEQGSRVHAHGNEVRLTPKEFDLFVYMARRPNRVLTHASLLEAVWGVASQEQPEYLRVFMGQLRKKLEPDPSAPKYLLTEPWVGYRFNPKGGAG
jgi:hypothetical protein